MGEAIHAPVDLLAGQDWLKFLLLAKLHHPAVADVYHKVYDKPEQPNFLDGHPMVRANYMLGEFEACIHLLHGILYPEPDAFHKQAMDDKFQAFNALFSKLSCSLEYEITEVESNIRNYCKTPAEWSAALEEMTTQLSELENHTNNKTLDTNPTDNALLHDYLENTLYERMFHLIQEIEHDVYVWSADVVRTMPDSKRSMKGFTMPETILDGALQEPKNEGKVVSLRPRKTEI